MTPPAALLSADAWRQIAGWLAAADIDCIEIGAPGRELRMVRGADAYRVEEVPSPAAAAGRAAALVVVAPCAGILLERHPGGGFAFAQPGDRVRAGDLLGLLQIGLVLVPVAAPVAGTLGRMLVASGTLVGYGTRLVAILEGET